MANEHMDNDVIALIDRIAPQSADSRVAMRELYELTSRRLFGLAYRVAGNRDWAEDVVQEAYINIWRSASTYRATLSPPLAWMGLIVRSRALDFLRRRAAGRADHAQDIDDGAGENIESETMSPMDTAQASEQAWALHECLRKLDVKQREAVSLAYLRDMSHGELADQLKIPLGTVKTWIRRGIEQLRTCMSRFA